MRTSIAGWAAAALSVSAAMAERYAYFGPDPIVDFIPTGPVRGPIHRRGKFKPNARRQIGRKTLPRSQP